MPLRNSWFAAPSSDVAANILIQALHVDEEAPMFNTPSEVSQAIPEASQSGAEEQTTETETTDTLLSKHLAPCATQDADTAAEIRKELTQRLGKTVAKQILKSCVTTVVKTSTGNKSRVLKANGKLLKLKTQT